MSAPRVYVAAPYDRAFAVRAFHTELGKACCLPVSHWANLAKGPERLEAMSRGELRTLIEVNDECIRTADLLVCLSMKGEGRETFAEVARALEWGKPVLWCGAVCLSAYRAGVFLCANQRDVLDACYVAAIRPPILTVEQALSVYFRGEGASARSA